MSAPRRSTALPRFHDLQTRPDEWPLRDVTEIASLAESLKGTVFVEYAVPNQGVGLFVHSRVAPTVREGLLCRGVHLAGSDVEFHNYMQGGEDDIGVVHQFHLWSE